MLFAIGLKKHSLLEKGEAFADWIIQKAFDFTVFLFTKFYHSKKDEMRFEALKELPKGTVGRDIAECLVKENKMLIPKFENHDLKHILLDYDMHSKGEIRLQAFMLGNGNITVPSMAILLYGMLLMPRSWRVFYQDFRKGLDTIPIADFQIEQFKTCSTGELKKQLAEGFYGVATKAT